MCINILNLRRLSLLWNKICQNHYHCIVNIASPNNLKVYRSNIYNDKICKSLWWYSFWHEQQFQVYSLHKHWYCSDAVLIFMRFHLPVVSNLVVLFSLLVIYSAEIFQAYNLVLSFFQLLLLPKPPFKQIYYTLVIIDLCKVVHLFLSTSRHFYVQLLTFPSKFFSLKKIIFMSFRLFLGHFRLL